MTERLLRTRQLAEVLGFSPATVQDWAEAGKLPAFKLGGQLRFRLSEVEDWLESQRLGAGLTHRGLGVYAVDGCRGSHPSQIDRPGEIGG